MSSALINEFIKFYRQRRDMEKIEFNIGFHILWTAKLPPSSASKGAYYEKTAPLPK